MYFGFQSANEYGEGAPTGGTEDGEVRGHTRMGHGNLQLQKKGEMDSDRWIDLVFSPNAMRYHFCIVPVPMIGTYYLYASQTGLVRPLPCPGWKPIVNKLLRRRGAVSANMPGGEKAEQTMDAMKLQASSGSSGAGLAVTDCVKNERTDDPSRQKQRPKETFRVGRSEQ